MPDPRPAICVLTLALPGFVSLTACQSPSPSASTPRNQVAGAPEGTTGSQEDETETISQTKLVTATPTTTNQNISPWDDYYDEDANNWLSRLLFGGSQRSGQALTNDAIYPFDADVRRKAIANLVDHVYGDTNNAVKMYRLLLGASGNPPTAQFPADPDPTVRAISAKALGIHGEPQDVLILLPLIKDDSGMVRLEAATALQKLHNPAAVGPLVGTLIGDQSNRDAIASTADEDPDVRAAAATALGQYKRPRAYGGLVTGLFDRDFAVVAACHESLVTMTGQSQLTTSPDDWIEYGEANRDTLFTNGEPFLYESYPGPPSFWRKLAFWSPPKPPAPQPPKGTEG